MAGVVDMKKAPAKWRLSVAPADRAAHPGGDPALIPSGTPSGAPWVCAALTPSGAPKGVAPCPLGAPEGA